MLCTHLDSVSQDLVDLSRLPSRKIRKCDAMWAYGSHYRCLDEEENNFVSFDSSVTAVMKTWYRSSAPSWHPVEADLTYVGVVQRILEVRYSETPRTVLQCFWIRPNLDGIPTTCKDANGVWLVKYSSRQQPEREPYVFLYNVKQVHFVDDKDDPDWKTVVEVESRSRRVYEGASGMHADGEADMNDGIEVELEPAPAPPPPVGEAIPLEHV